MPEFYCQRCEEDRCKVLTTRRGDRPHGCVLGLDHILKANGMRAYWREVP